MGRMPRAVYLWPGLPMILASGSWGGLVWAVGFALLVNFLLLATLWWPELMSYHVRNGMVLGALVFWTGSAIASARALRGWGRIEEPDGRPTFADATTHYLRGEWFEAESILIDLLRHNRRDVDAGLMLATLWRHTDRLSEAERQLDRLALLEESRKWTLEIHQERKRLDALRQEASSGAQQAVVSVEAA